MSLNSPNIGSSGTPEMPALVFADVCAQAPLTLNVLNVMPHKQLRHSRSSAVACNLSKIDHIQDGNQ